MRPRISSKAVAIRGSVPQVSCYSGLEGLRQPTRSHRILTDAVDNSRNMNCPASTADCRHGFASSWEAQDSVRCGDRLEAKRRFALRRPPRRAATTQPTKSDAFVVMSCLHRSSPALGFTQCLLLSARIVLQIAHDFCRRTGTPAEGQRTT